ncbi:MAG: hypothetical protein ACOC1K_00530 [Nanoarchaeota archaeon]
MGIVKQIKRTFDVSFKKEWFETYWAFDIHGTILKPTYDLNKEEEKFYPYALESLQVIERRSDIIKILYTCSYPHEIEKYQKLFKDNGIHFLHVNENPGISSNMGNFGFYEQKFYFNVLFEDKAGFDPETEWKEVYELMKHYEDKNILPDPNWTKKY